MIETITFKGEAYPKFQSEGNAAKFVLPFAHQVCKGVGIDIGCNRMEWCYKDIDGKAAFAVDPILNSFTATNFPYSKLDYVFSSHCLEHVPDWVEALGYIQTKLKIGGVLFLYLPHYEQRYWRSWNNRKHIHNLSPQMIKDYLTDNQWSNIFVSERDLNHSFAVMAQK
jgi:predicted SAM-dependent methyltransferase